MMMREKMLRGLCPVVFLFLGGVMNSAFGQTSPLPADVPDDHCLSSTCRDAPTRETLNTISLQSKNRGTKYVRGVVGGFEQGSGVSGGVQFTTADAIPHFEFRANALTSTKLDRRFDLEGIFHTTDNRNHVDVWFSDMDRQTDFFGIGRRRIDAATRSFETEQRGFQGSFYRDFNRHFLGGVFAQVMNSHSELGKSKADTPMTSGFSGSPTPGAAQWLPGFQSPTKILSSGAFLEYDARDKSKGLTRGFDIYSRVASNDGIRNHGAVQDYGWLEGEMDARGYIPLGNSGPSLAMRSRLQLKKTKGGSQIPFYDLSYLGGREFVRGYRSYRFRGNDSLMFSTELRQTVYKKKPTRGVDVFAFADSGQVWGDSRSVTDPIVLANQRFSSSHWRSGVGGGVQYRHSRGLAARVEAGRTNEGTIVYVSMSRGF